MEGLVTSDRAHTCDSNTQENPDAYLLLPVTILKPHERKDGPAMIINNSIVVYPPDKKKSYPKRVSGASISGKRSTLGVKSRHRRKRGGRRRRARRQVYTGLPITDGSENINPEEANNEDVQPYPLQPDDVETVMSNAQELPENKDIRFQVDTSSIPTVGMSQFIDLYCKENPMSIMLDDFDDLILSSSLDSHQHLMDIPLSDLYSD